MKGSTILNVGLATVGASVYVLPYFGVALPAIVPVIGAGAIVVAALMFLLGGKRGAK